MRGSDISALFFQSLYFLLSFLLTISSNKPNKKWSHRMVHASAAQHQLSVILIVLFLPFYIISQLQNESTSIGEGVGDH